MNNSFSDAGDQLFELGQSTAKKFVKDVVKGVPKAAKQQITGDDKNYQDIKDSSPQQDKKQVKNTDPVTGKPPPTKKMLTQLTQATSQLQMQKLQKVREELDKIRLKVTDEKQKLAPGESAKSTGQGPEMPEEKPKEQGDVVATTLRNAQSTGETGKNLGG